MVVHHPSSQRWAGASRNGRKIDGDGKVTTVVENVYLDGADDGNSIDDDND